MNVPTMADAVTVLSECFQALTEEEMDDRFMDDNGAFEASTTKRIVQAALRKAYLTGQHDEAARIRAQVR